MLISEISNQVNNLASAWEHFKVTNEQRIKEVERKGFADPLIDDKLRRVNQVLDDYRDRLNNIEVSIARPDLMDQINVKEDYSSREHKEAFYGYLKKGNEKNLNMLEQKALSVGSDSDGGYLVSRPVSKNIIQVLTEKSPIRQLVSIETISSDALDLIEDYNEAGAGWTSETGPVSDTATPNINKRRILVHELYAQPKATQKLIDDANIDIEKWLVAKLVDIFAAKENAGFIYGDGEGKPRGLLSYPDGNEWGNIQQIKTSASDGSVSPDDIFNLMFALKETYASKGTFLMNRSMVQKIRMLKDKTSSQYLWSPSLTMGTPSALLGIPVFQSTDMPNAEKGNLSVIFADFQAAYKIVDRVGIRVMRDPFTDKPFVKFYTTKRVGGDVTNFRAIKILKV